MVEGVSRAEMPFVLEDGGGGGKLLELCCRGVCYFGLSSALVNYYFCVCKIVDL